YLGYPATDLPQEKLARETALPSSLRATIFLPPKHNSSEDWNVHICRRTISIPTMHRKNAAQLWRKCPSCQRELFSEDHFCTTCGQCLDCCQGTHAAHQPQKQCPLKVGHGSPSMEIF